MFPVVAAIILDFVLLPILIMVISPPPRKRARRGRRVSPSNQQAAPDAVVDDVLRAENSGFTVAHLDAGWDNAPDGAATTWAERICAGVDYWLSIKDVRPSDLITSHKVLRKKNAFSRTECAYKNGMAAIIIYKTAYGSQAVFDNETQDAFLNSLNVEGNVLFERYVLPMVNIFVDKFNTENHKGLVLKKSDILNVIYGNWQKNMDVRGAKGAWSDEEVLERMEEFDGVSDDLDICKGLYYPWYCTICQHFEGIHEQWTSSNSGHVITDAQNTTAAWDAAVAAGLAFV